MMKETEIREAWTEINNEMLWTTADEDDAVATWWLALRAKELGEMRARIEKQKQQYEEIAERADTKVQQAETEEDVAEWTDMVVHNLAKADALNALLDDLIEKPR